MILANATPETETWLFIGFGILIATFLVLDLGVFSKKAHKISTRSALLQSAAWITIALVFGLVIYYYDDHEMALEYYSAYLTEYALSVDNIFVIILILRYFKVDERYYHKVLFWGIIGALAMRAIFIFLGALLIQEFHGVLYIFGVFLLYTGIKMLLHKDKNEEELDADNNPVMRLARRYLPFVHTFHEDKFYIRRAGKLFFTPLFMVILLVESTDLIFAVDSIPAVFGISQNQFVIYTSNIFAVMGLRAMFFLLAGVLDKFYLLQKGLSFVLIFIGIKMMLGLLTLVKSLGIDEHDIHIPVQYSLGFIVLILGGSILLSLAFPKGKANDGQQGPTHNHEVASPSQP
jgi:tellurite resistance protein TerC